MSGNNDLEKFFNGIKLFSTLQNKDDAFIYIGSEIYLHKVREYVKKNPGRKKEIIEALELLLTELKAKK